MSFTCRNCRHDFTTSGEIVQRYVYEDFDVLVVKPKKPLVEGHLMFVPTRHVNNFAEDQAAYVTSIIAGTISQHLAGDVRDANIVFAQGEHAGQKMPIHLHADYYPRSKNDKLKIV